MLSPQEKEAMQSVFNEDGFEGVVQFMSKKEGLSREDAIESANALGFGGASTPSPDNNGEESPKPASSELSEDSNLGQAGDSSEGSVDGSNHEGEDEVKE